MAGFRLTLSTFLQSFFTKSRIRTLFRNFDEHGNPFPWPNTLLIDSEQLEAGEPLDAVLVHEVWPDARTHIVNTGNYDRSLSVGNAFVDPTANLRVYVESIDPGSKTATLVVGGVPPTSSATVSPPPGPSGWTGTATVTFNAASGPSNTPVSFINYTMNPASAPAVSGTAPGAHGSTTVSSSFSR